MRLIDSPFATAEYSQDTSMEMINPRETGQSANAGWEETDFGQVV